jgi:transcriptional regulator with XRE-family HTH domain
MSRSTEEAREAIRAVLQRTGLSMRALSAAMGRDPGYIAAYLDPTRPSRTRPTPDDLVAASDATGISLVELLEGVWGIRRERLADELAALGVGSGLGPRFEALSDAERAEVADYIGFLAARRRRSGRTPLKQGPDPGRTVADSGGGSALRSGRR